MADGTEEALAKAEMERAADDFARRAQEVLDENGQDPQ